MTKSLVILLCVLASGSALGQGTPSDHCTAPLRPVDEQNDALWQRFLAEIDAFRDCVNGQMEWHQGAAKVHQEKARLAVERWNEFVRTSLNAPEDFPWPPEE